MPSNGLRWSSATYKRPPESVVRTSAEVQVAQRRVLQAICAAVTFALGITLADLRQCCEGLLRAALGRSASWTEAFEAYIRLWSLIVFARVSVLGGVRANGGQLRLCPVAHGRVVLAGGASFVQAMNSMRQYVGFEVCRTGRI